MPVSRRANARLHKGGPAGAEGCPSPEGQMPVSTGAEGRLGGVSLSGVIVVAEERTSRGRRGVSTLAAICADPGSTPRGRVGVSTLAAHPGAGAGSGESES